MNAAELGADALSLTKYAAAIFLGVAMSSLLLEWLFTTIRRMVSV
jgi:hypothetical protein